MADIEVRIYDLTTEANPASGDFLIIDNPDWTEPRATSVGELLQDYTTAMVDADNAIIAGCGLDSDGSLSAIPASSYLKNADFTAAGLDINLKNALILHDTAIKSITDNSNLTIQVTLSSAEILALNSSPVQKVSPPNIDTFYDVSKVIAKNNFNTTPYTMAGDDGIELWYTGAASRIALLSKNFCISNATIRKSFNVVDDLEILLNTGLTFLTRTGDPTLGDGTIDVIIEYTIKQDFAGIPSSPPSGCCVTPVSDTFVAGDLTGLGNLVVAHNMGTTNVFVVVFDNLGQYQATSFVVGDEAGADTLNQVTIPIGAMAGIWSYWIIGKAL